MCLFADACSVGAGIYLVGIDSKKGIYDLLDFKWIIVAIEHATNLLGIILPVMVQGAV